MIAWMCPCVVGQEYTALENIIALVKQKAQPLSPGERLIWLIVVAPQRLYILSL